MSTSTLFDNRITRAIQAATIRHEALDADAQAEFDEIATLEPADLLVLADRPSRGLVAGLITVDEATRLAAIHRSFETATPAERFVFIQVCAELHRAGA